MPCQPGLDLSAPVGGAVVNDRMDQSARRHLAFDGIEEADELRVPVSLHAATDHVLFSMFNAAKNVVVHGVCSRGHGAAAAGFSGSPGWVRSSAWTGSSLIESTTAWRRNPEKADENRYSRSDGGLCERLKLRTGCGWSCAAQMRAPKPETWPWHLPWLAWFETRLRAARHT